MYKTLLGTFSRGFQANLLITLKGYPHFMGKDGLEG